MENYLVVIQKQKHNYGAYSPDVLGCIATGKSIELTLKNMKEALELHFEAMIEDEEELPKPKGLAYYLNQKEAIAEPNDLITNVEVRIPNFV